MLWDLKDYIMQSQANDIIIAGDTNEDIESINIQNFLISCELFEIYNQVNYSNKRRDPIHITRTKAIYIVAVSIGLLLFINGY